MPEGYRYWSALNTWDISLRNRGLMVRIPDLVGRARETLIAS